MRLLTCGSQSDIREKKGKKDYSREESGKTFTTKEV